MPAPERYWSLLRTIVFESPFFALVSNKNGGTVLLYPMVPNLVNHDKELPYNRLPEPAPQQSFFLHKYLRPRPRTCVQYTHSVVGAG